MPVVTLYSKGGQYTNSGYQEIFEMIRERHKLVSTDISLADQTGLDQRKSLINQLRAWVEEILSGYLNTDVHPGGSINGADTLTYWTKATVLAAAGVGGTDAFGQRNWTNVPTEALGGDPWDRTTFVSDLFGPVVLEGMSLYDVWLNEIIKVCRKLTHAKGPTVTVVPQTVTDHRGARRTASKPTGITCDGVKAMAASDLAGLAWGTHLITYLFLDNDPLVFSGEAFVGFPIGVGFFTLDMPSYQTVGAYVAWAIESRAKLTVNLSALPADYGAKMFLKLRVHPGEFTWSPHHPRRIQFYDFGQPKPTSQPVSLWGEWPEAGLIPHQNNTTGYLTGTEGPLTPVGTCPVSSAGDTNGLLSVGHGEGWTLQDQIVIVAPAFTYT